MPAPGEDAVKVVVALLDRKRERGYVAGFRPFGDGFTLLPAAGPKTGPGRFIDFRTCKAVYFVRSLEGNKAFKENKLTLPPTYRQGRKVSVDYPDGERTVGTTEGFNPSRVGFFMYPADPKSNNTEVFVITGNTDEIRIIGGETDGTDKVFRPRAEKGIFAPEKRLEAVQRVLRGEPLEKVAKELSIPPVTLMDWRGKFLAGGPAALGVGAPGSGPPPPGGPPAPAPWKPGPGTGAPPPGGPPRR